MPDIIFEGERSSLERGETVLEGLERLGQAIPNGCRSGVCHSCVLRALEGAVPAIAQKGLKPAHQAQGYFLACKCMPDDDLTIARAADVVERRNGAITAIEPLNERVLRVRLELAEPLEYFPGQFVNFVRPNGLVRSFSLASVPALDRHLECHVAVVPNGRMSGWLYKEAAIGEALEIQGPLGECFYTPGKADQPLLLIGTGTGLAPLYAIARDALHQGHTGEIHLFHGGSEPRNLYLVEELRKWDRENEPFHYHACLRNGPGEPWMHEGSVEQVALSQFPSLKGWRVFLCGNPDMVRRTQRSAFLAGASMREIHADAFLPAGGQ